MKGLSRFHLLTIALATFAALLILWLWFPANLLFKGVILVLVPSIILILGFQNIYSSRIKTIRNQLHQVIQTLEEFDIDQPKTVAFEPSPFSIFNELNEYLIELIDRIRDNYRANKQFTQNASHELQTPLAIIKGHIEILLQSPNIKKKEFESLAIVLQNTNRLSKLNKALILLSKIENQPFPDFQLVNFNTLTTAVLNNFNDLIEIQQLDIRKEYEEEFTPEMSHPLAEILITNLIQNAIRYNTERGYLSINIKSNVYTISNPGKPLSAAPESLFRRFKRESEVEESLGLGLSIVKRICDQNNLNVLYLQEGNIHILQIKKIDN